MDYVDWCGLVLQRLNEARQTDNTTRMMGVSKFELTKVVFHRDILFENNPETMAVLTALRDLERRGLVAHKHQQSWWLLTDSGIRYLDNPLPIWHTICNQKLDTDQEKVLNIINRMSPASFEEYVSLQEITETKIYQELEWSNPDNDALKLFTILKELKDKGFDFFLLGLGERDNIRATFAGLVWETKQEEVRQWHENLYRKTYIMGDQINISNVQNSILNIKTQLANVTQTVEGMQGIDENAKQELIEVVEQLRELLEKVPPEHIEDAETAVQRVNAIVKELSSSNPDKEIVSVNAESLKKAAQNIDAVMPQVFNIVMKFLNLVQPFLPV
ncbi:MAG: hypothetical protein HC914_19300 [Chloroflexaceae bacterium]|nr:hypothetical protein [Chloroflexaceae bacterium]